MRRGWSTCSPQRLPKDPATGGRPRSRSRAAARGLPRSWEPRPGMRLARDPWKPWTMAALTGSCVMAWRTRPAASTHCLTRARPGQQRDQAEAHAVRAHSREPDRPRGQGTRVARARLGGCRFRRAARGTMTGRGKLATRTALAAIVLATFVAGVLPSARAEPDVAEEATPGTAGRPALPTPATWSCNARSTSSEATCRTTTRRGSAGSWQPTAWSFSFWVS